MSKFYNKETVTYKFKWEVMTLDGNSGLSDSGKEKLWTVFLYQLANVKLISHHSSKTWIYPRKALKIQKK